MGKDVAVRTPKVEISEKVSASVSIDLPHKIGGLGTNKVPVDRMSIKTMEDFLFNARMRGAGDDSDIIFTHQPFWNGYDHTSLLSGFKVNVGASLNGFPLLAEPTPVVKKTPSLFTAQSFVMVLPFSFVIIFILKLLGG